MKIFIASDHGGLELKEFLKIQDYPNLNVEFIDLGPSKSDSVDYPDFAKKLCLDIKEAPNSLGMAMTANKFSYIRAALCWNEELAFLAKSHNNANVLCLGGRVIDHNLAVQILQKFLTTPYEGGRHDMRLQKMKDATNV
jgi:ribose 5-phosphate isomerase B